jgi:hypothetical protein
LLKKATAAMASTKAEYEARKAAKVLINAEIPPEVLIEILHEIEQRRKKKEAKK